MRIFFHVHQVHFQDFTRRGFEETNPRHGAAGDLHHLAHRVSRILQRFRAGIEAVHLAVPGYGIGEINSQAGHVPQGASKLAAIEPARAARPQGPLLFLDPGQDLCLFRGAELGFFLRRHLAGGKLLMYLRPQMPVGDTEAIHSIVTQAGLLFFGPMTAHAIFLKNRLHHALKRPGIHTGFIS